MEARIRPTGHQELKFDARLAAALALTLVGGFVDAFGYIALFQIFTANMSGNSIHVGMGLGRLDLSALARPAFAIASYVTGMIATRVAIEVASRRGIQRIATGTLAFEALLLLIFFRATPAMHLGQVVDLHSPAYFAMIAVLAIAMGVQTATLTHSGPLTVYTTFVTGTLTKFSEAFTEALFWIKDAYDAGKSGRRIAKEGLRSHEVANSAFLLAMWICYVMGAAFGTVAKHRWEFRALLIPVAMLTALIALDRKYPISAQEDPRHSTSGS